MIKYTLTEGTWSSMPRDKDPRSWRSGWKSASSAPYPPKKPPKKKPESLVETRNLGRIRKGLLVGKEISLSLSLSLFETPFYIFSGLVHRDSARRGRGRWTVAETMVVIPSPLPIQPLLLPSPLPEQPRRRRTRTRRRRRSSRKGKKSKKDR